MISVNGTDLATLGFVARSRDLPYPGGEASTVVTIPGAVGGVRLGGEVEPGALVVPGTLTGATHAELLTRRDALAAALRGECVIRLDDYADREWVGWLQRHSIPAPLGPAWRGRALDLTLEWMLPDPTARARTETNVTGLAPALVLGTAPSPLRIQLTNGNTAVITRIVVAVRAGAATLRTLDWSGSLAKLGVWVCDTELHQVTAAGANALDGLTPASEFPVADPAEGATALAITVTGGGGHTVQTTYRKRWW